MTYDDWKTTNPFESDDCGHEAPHGRRGYGSCSHRDLTPEGRAAVAKFEGMAPAVARRLIECVVALPGMAIDCKCVRVKKGRAPTRRDADEGQEPQPDPRTQVPPGPQHRRSYRARGSLKSRRPAHVRHQSTHA